MSETPIARAALFVCVVLTLSCADQEPLTPPVDPTCPVPRLAPPAPNVPDTWQWETLGPPMGDTQVYTIRVDPQDPSLWYVGTGSSLLLTRDAGQTWQRALPGRNTWNVEIAPGDPCTVYAAISQLRTAQTPQRSTLYRSTNRGLSWTAIFETPELIITLHLSPLDGKFLLLGMGPTKEVVDGIYRSMDEGLSWSRHSWENTTRGFIPWDIGEDKDGVLYACLEIATHPQPYRAPVFTSLDRGATWIAQPAGNLAWHVIRFQGHPTQALMYAQSEGAGLFVSADGGVTWVRRGVSTIANGLLLDPLHPNRLYSGNGIYLARGGVHLSTDDGAQFRSIGLEEIQISRLALDGASTMLYAAGYGTGLYRARVPSSP